MDISAPSSPILMWFRHDLRVDDNPALRAALRHQGPVIAVFVLDETSEGMRALGGAARWWLHHTLDALAGDLGSHRVRLVLKRGDCTAVIPDLANRIGASQVVWNRRYDPGGIAADTTIKARLKSEGIHAESHNAALLYEPWQVKTGAGAPYRVFSPFWRAARALGAPEAPVPAPTPNSGRPHLPQEIESDRLKAWALRPARPDWAGGLRETWTPGEAGGRERLSTFLDTRLRHYARDRDRPGKTATSMLSPHLRFGEISPRRIWHAAAHRAADPSFDISDQALSKFQAELGWREFSYHLLFHFPDIGTRNFQPRFDAFPWRTDRQDLAAWQRGMTGYPLVDAGMRELWHTGYMHNRVRMVVASFLVKHLMIDWRAGEAWFWDTLVDADPANNTASWQWVAGSGADAAPYFRIFNPTAQGEKFDPDGAYTRRWVPELAKIPKKYLYQPHDASPDLLNEAGIRLGVDYPFPIVDHSVARQRALDAFQTTKTAA